MSDTVPVCGIRLQEEGEEECKANGFRAERTEVAGSNVYLKMDVHKKKNNIAGIAQSV
jgi:hypothetical protein